MTKTEQKPNSATRKTAPSPAIKNRLGAVVLEVFSEEDFHRADMRTIAKKAGVSFETIYKYYGSKEKLLFAFIDEWLNELIEQSLRNLEGVTDTKEKLQIVVWTQLNYYQQNPEMAKILYMTIPLATWMSEGNYRQKRLADIVLGIIREGKDKGVLNPNIKASLLLDVLYGMVRRCFTMWIFRGRKESLMSQAEDIFTVIWDGIAKPEEKR
jgi:AcrR family transcriptional regulator